MTEGLDSQKIPRKIVVSEFISDRIRVFCYFLFILSLCSIQLTISHHYLNFLIKYMFISLVQVRLIIHLRPIPSTRLFFKKLYQLFISAA